MQYAVEHTPQPHPSYRIHHGVYNGWSGMSDTLDMQRIRCGWNVLRAQLLLQWARLSARDLDEVGPHRRNLARLIQRRYGIAAELVENYLRNVERALSAA